MFEGHDRQAGREAEAEVSDTVNTLEMIDANSFRPGIPAAVRPALISPRMRDRLGDEAPWRRRLSGELVVLVAIKLAALALLWWLFFSPTHRTDVDPEAASRRLGVTDVRTPDLPGAAPVRAQGARRD